MQKINDPISISLRWEKEKHECEKFNILICLNCLNHLSITNDIGTAFVKNSNISHPSGQILN